MGLIAGVNSQKDLQLPHFGTRTCSGKTPASKNENVFFNPKQVIPTLVHRLSYSKKRSTYSTSLRQELLHNQHSKSNHGHKPLFTTEQKPLAFLLDNSDNTQKMTCFLVTVVADLA